MSGDYLFDPKGADPDGAEDRQVQDLERALAPLRYQGALPELPQRRAPRGAYYAMAAAAAVLVLCVGALLWWSQRTPQQAPQQVAAAAQWRVEATEGSPAVDGARLTSDQAGALGVGEWIETDARSSARVQVADIGHMRVGPGSRLKLEATGGQHRLRLERGRVHAKVIAPPRILVVDTPLATAVDLGCEYTLEVEPDGAAMLRVISGFVALETPSHSVFVPEGASAYTGQRVGLGTPVFDDAPKALREAVRGYDRAPEPEALTRILDASRERDTLALWHLLYRAPEDERGRIFDRMVALAPDRRPKGLTREHAVTLNRQRLQAWQDQLWLSW